MGGFMVPGLAFAGPFLFKGIKEQHRRDNSKYITNVIAVINEFFFT